MVVKHEIKSQLAKLLATEDLIVEHRSVETAHFDVHNRVLTLPRWEKATNNVYDALVSHEVGHALYTPDRDWSLEVKVPQTFVNIVEDVRIEKLMKRRYAGIAKTFYNGYNELSDQDFFDIDGEDLSTFNLADRINLYCKVGAWNDISFSDSEKEIINLIQNAETFDQTLSAAETLYNFCKQELEDKQREEVDTEQDSKVNFKGDGNFSSDDGDDSGLTFSNSGSNGTMEDGIGSNDPSSIDVDTNSVEPEVETVKSLEDSIKELNDDGVFKETAYIELPKLKLEECIVPNDRIHEECDLYWSADEYSNFDYPDNQFVKFKRDSQKEVNYLVKEFECKKAADSYARATTARTGVLDCSKLHTYKHNEDLFKKVTTFADGKNHGLVFVLDWSGSMNQVMLDTIKQLYVLMWFCKKVNIPFEVYAFTNNYPISKEEFRKPFYEKKEGVAFIDDTFSLMNIFSSKVNSKNFDGHLRNIFRIAYSFNYGYSTYSVPIGMELSGTPLNESLIALHQILPKFKKENNLQKVQCVVLTDGESSPLRYSKMFQRNYDTNPYWGSNYIDCHCVIRNRKTGHTYSCEGLGHWADVTDLLINDLRRSFPDTNFIGIRIISSRDAGPFIRRYTGYEDNLYERIMKIWKKEKSFSLKDTGYHTYFGLSSSILDNEDEFEVQEDATKAQIKRAFAKSLKMKKLNKRVLSEFISLVS